MKKSLIFLFFYFSFVFASISFSQDLKTCDSLYNKDKFDECSECLTNYLALYPEDTGAYVKRAKTYLIVRKFEEAIIDLTKLINYGQFGNLHLRRGYAYFVLGNYDSAIIDFNLHLDKDPNEDLLYRWRGFSYYFKGNYSEAINNYNKSMELFPEDKTPLLYRGLAYKKMGLTTEAKKDFNDVKVFFDGAIKNGNYFNCNNCNYIYYYQYAIANCGLDNTTDALEYWEKGKKFNPYPEADFIKFFECK